MAAPQVEEDGSHLLWPTDLEALPLFGLQVADVLARQGWCVIETLKDDDLRSRLQDEARRLDGFHSLKPEFVPDYLGRGGVGKVAYLEDPEVDPLSGEWPSNVGALESCNIDLVSLTSMLASLAEEALGFQCDSRRKALVCMPYDSRKEMQAMKVEPLSHEDAEDGVIEDHLRFIRQRRLGLLWLVDNEGGELQLLPSEDFAPSMSPVKLPMMSNRLVVYRADLITFACKPKPLSRSIMLQTWLMEPMPQLTMKSIAGDAVTVSRAQGILKGIPRPDGTRIHIQTIAVRMAAEVQDKNQKFTMYASGCDGFIRIPYTRFDLDLYCCGPDERDPGKSYTRHSSMVSDSLMWDFAHEDFGISHHEALCMTPAQRLTLEEGYTALARAGYNRMSLKGAKIGVYCGDTGSDWNPFTGVANYGMSPKEVNGHAALGASACVTANRLSHALSLCGPTSAIDTACSASLVAVQVAANNMRQVDRGQRRVLISSHVTEAVCMGISVQVGPGSFIALCGGTMLSPEGRCKTFNNSGDGYARGDGCCTSYMNISNSEDDNEEQLACLLGVAANQDGRSANLTAPNGPAQQACIRESMREAGMSAKQISIAEMHGTGTALGDPIEVGSLRQVMEPRDGPIGETSAKSHIGHLEACAGIIGLCKSVLMMSASLGTPNVHLRQLNAHMDMQGFPVYFHTEYFDTGLESGVSGVSSFGFGGTNCRADLWGQCRKGSRRTGIGKLADDWDQALAYAPTFQTTCPVTLEPIEYLTGEPIAMIMADGRPRYRADVLREVLAPYDISRHAYSGGFRYRSEEPTDAFYQDLPPGHSIYICGSWSGWLSTQQMESQGDGWYSIRVALGNTRCERFHIFLDDDRTKCIHPKVKNANYHIQALGPDEHGSGLYWIIDGRDEEVPIGTVYEIGFKWGKLHKRVVWQQVEPDLPPTVESVEARYQVTGTFNAWGTQEMSPVEGEDGSWEATARLGATGRESFRFMRDCDKDQLIYPARRNTSSMGVPVCGPDDLGAAKQWVVRGSPGDLLRLKLTVTADGIGVKVALNDKAPNVWESLSGWNRHQYHVVGSWRPEEPIPMVMDPTAPGTFKCRIAMPDSYQFELGCHAVRFVVVVDGDATQAWTPPEPDATSGKHIVSGPDGNFVRNGFQWLLTSRDASDVFEVHLNLATHDRRQTVTWFYVPPAPPLSLEQ